MICRFCSSPLTRTFVDLGMQPLSNAYVDPAAGPAMEAFFPLHVFVCEKCLLVQLPEFASPERIFTDYAYLSSMSSSWLEHCQRYASQVIERFGLSSSSSVIEIASNDGYLLRFFQEHGIKVLGVEPAANVAAIAEKAGVPTRPSFFSTNFARELVNEGIRADLLVGNNVLAHVPNLNDFVAGLAMLLAPNGVLTMEFPHLGKLVAERQFDTIYHEHFSYFSFGTVDEVFRAHGLTLFDVEQLTTHGGSLRVYARRAVDSKPDVTERVAALHASEQKTGERSLETYARFAEDVREVKRKLLEFLIAKKRERRQVVAYGAPAKGNTLLNYCGIGTDFLDYTVDRSPLKQGKLLPGSHIPVFAPEHIAETRPEYVIVLPWNLKDEIREQLAYVKTWGGQLVVPIPEPVVLG